MTPLSRTILINTLLSTSLCSSLSLAAETKTATRQTVVENVGFATPESIEYYKAEDVYLVSNLKGGLDGLLILEDGRLIMSSWGGSAIYALNKKKTYSILADSLDSPADLGLDTKRNRLLIPLFKQNKLVFQAL